MEYDKLVNIDIFDNSIECTCFKNYSSLQFGILTTGCKAKIHKCFCDEIIDKLCFDDCTNCITHICICNKLSFPSGKVDLCKSHTHECICNITPLIDSKKICKSHKK